MNSTAADQVVLESDKKTNSVVILMHGLGADGNDFVPIAPMLDLPHTRFIFPHAQVMPVTINGGAPMRAWFDITAIDLSAADGVRKTSSDTKQILASVERAHAIADAQVESGVAAERVVFAGFSQGGVIALIAGLTWDKRAGGILALSTYFPDDLLRESWPQQPAIYMTHGQHDEVIPVQSGQHSYELLKNSGADIEFHIYPMGHEVIPQEIAEFKSWLQQRLVTE